ncbi:MAG: hypothetical protein ACR2OM_03645 [Aestuariivirgaceae bacterium]
MPVSSTRVTLDGGLLRQTRKLKGYPSRSSFVDSLNDSGRPTISLSTLQRAELSQRIDISSARYICAFLDESVDRFLIDQANEVQEFEPDLSGEWIFFFIECDAYRSYNVRRGVCHLTMNEDGIIGKDFIADDKGKAVERIVTARRIRNVIMGETTVDGSTPPYGCGQFMAALRRGDDWLDGVSTWYDRDTDRVEWSRDIWVRRSCLDEEALIDLAKREMDEELRTRFPAPSR